MTDKQNQVKRWLAGKPFSEMFKGMLPGLAVYFFAVLMFRLFPPAAAETFLPQQDISISGQVTAPSCQARLDADNLSFSNVPRADGKGDDNRKVFTLSLSECEIDGLGVMFKADSLPGYPARGALRKTSDSSMDPDIWYSIAPGVPETHDIPVMVLSADSPVLEKGPKGEGYFSLSQEQYWFDVNATLKGSDIMTVPFDIEIHRADKQTSVGESLEAHFTLQLSYK